MEWAIEKAVELGCSRIVPIIAERTEKHLAQAAGKRAERWRRLALEAAKQSRRSDLPEIPEPARLAAMLAAAEPTGSLRNRQYKRRNHAGHWTRRWMDRR
jgi:16S rRNA (uracil1498-N3)-methyltransferase